MMAQQGRNPSPPPMTRLPLPPADSAAAHILVIAAGTLIIWACDTAARALFS